MDTAVQQPVDDVTVIGPVTADRPLICVVIAAFDAARYLTDALDSLVAQTYQAWECVVVDDGSTDGTADIARRYVDEHPRIRLLEQSNGGSSRARNVGVSAASPAVSLVAFLDADDTWLPDTLAVLVARLGLSRGASGVYGLAEYMDAKGRPYLPGLHPMRQRDRRRMGRFDLTGLSPDQPYTFSSLIISGTLWPASVVLHRRDVFERVGGFDDEMRQLQDWELYIRMSRFGPFEPVNRQVAWYRQHDANITKRAGRVAYYTLLVRWKAWCSQDNTAEQRRQNQRIWRRLNVRWFVRAAVAEFQAWQDDDRPVGRQAAAASWLFARGIMSGHPTSPDEESARLFETFVTGVDREGTRDGRIVATGAGVR